MSKEQFPISAHYEHLAEKDPTKIIYEVHSEEQLEDYGCGQVVLTDILKTLGHNVTQKQMIEESEAELSKILPSGSKDTLETLGTPPEVLEKVLAKHGVDFSILRSESTENEEAKKILDQKLHEGNAVIAAVQTIPNFGEERDIDADGHYLIVCGVVFLEGEKFYVTVDPMFHYYQRASNENWVYGMHMEIDKNAAETESSSDTGESSKAKILPKTGPEIEHDTVETRTIAYDISDLNNFGINPEKYGLRLVAANNFIRNWKDMSGLGEPYFHYGIAIKVKNTEQD